MGLGERIRNRREKLGLTQAELGKLVGVGPNQIGVMGHSEGRGAMTAVYTDWEPGMFPEVYEAQGRSMAILAPNG